MKPQTKQKKLELKEDKIRFKCIQEVKDYLDVAFPKGSKKRGEALCLSALAFNKGIEAGKLIDKLK